MARRKGFLAEVNRQIQQAERRRRQEQAAAARAHAAAARAHVAAVREQERAERAEAAAQRRQAAATAAELKAAERERTRLHVEAREAEVEMLNAELADTYDQIDGILASTLSVDDFVDLEALRQVVKHPPFEPGFIQYELPKVEPPLLPPAPTYVEPPAPSRLSSALGGSGRHAKAVEAARATYAAQMQAWEGEKNRLQSIYRRAVEERDRAEGERLARLQGLRATYEAECAQRDAEASEANESLDALINGLAFDVEDAIAEYVDIVLSNSVYPDVFPVTHEHTFDLATRELTLTVTIPEPAALPSAKAYKYTKAKDEITATQLPVKAQKDRYAGAVHQVALRCLHEVFEADRMGKIHSISATVGVQRLSPATGQSEYVPLVIVAAARDTFTQFDLANVVPSATLEHLGASLSKSPFDLAPADSGPSVRRQGR